MTEAEIKKRRLRWHCRRGMLELDILLTRFFDEHFDALSAEDALLFERVLAQEDVVLYAWFIEGERPDHPKLADFVACMPSYSVLKGKTD